MHFTTSFLCLTLLLAILVTTTTQLQQYNDLVFAQEDEEEKEEDKDQEEEKEESSKDDDSNKEEEESDSKEEESSKDEDESSSDEPTTPTLPPEEPVNNNSQPTIMTLQPPIPQPQPEIITTTTAEPIIEKKFNATCKCMTTSGLAAQDEPTPTPTNNNPKEEQIPVTKADIQDFKSFGDVIDPAYTNYYTVPNLLDNVINDKSFWSQAGKSGFYIKLDNVLDEYQVCSAELNVHKPTNSPYLLDIGVSKNYTGVLDQVNERIQFEKCVKNMDEIFMIFDNPSNTFVSIGEIKLFGSKLGTTTIPQTTIPPPPPPPILEPTTTPPTTENATKINISDSTAEIDIKNSTVTFKFDPLTATFVGTNK